MKQPYHPLAFSPARAETLHELAGDVARRCAAHPAWRRGISGRPREATRRRSRRSAAESVVLGYSVGAKETAGKVTGDLAARVYVTKKLPLSALSRSRKVPGSIDGLATDVVEMRRPRLQVRPVPMGTSIGPAAGERGTLGCLVESTVDGTRCLLTAAHVFARGAGGHVGDPVLEPAQTDGGTDPIARLRALTPLDFDGGLNLVDGAVADLDRDQDVTLALPKIGRIEPDPLLPFIFQSLRKYGASTRHTLGIVTAIRATLEFTHIGGLSIIYADVYEVVGAPGPFSAGGDSGAVAVDALTNRAVGLLVGGTGDRSFLLPIGPTLDALKVRIVVP